jgi:hypothetical protein
MAKEKDSSEKSTSKKAAAKKSPKKAAAPPKKHPAEIIANTAPAVPPNVSGVPLKTTRPSPAELYDEIRRRAYEFYTERGGQHGSHEADWHRAESEVRSKYKS